MARSLSGSMITEYTSDTLAPVELIVFEFDSETVRFWNGFGTIAWGDDTFTGAGDLLAISPVSESLKQKAQGISFELSGVNQAVLAIALTENYQGRPVSIYAACVDLSTGLIVADPYLLKKASMDVMTPSFSRDTITITLTAENDFIDLETPRNRYLSVEDQAIDYPGDTGFRFIPEIQKKQIKWGPS